MTKKWQIYEINQEKQEQIEKLMNEYKINSLLATILVNRDMYEPEKLNVFLHPTRKDFHDPFLMPDMKKAVDRIKKAIEASEKIIIYGDYDADGITSITVLKKFLADCGIASRRKAEQMILDGIVKVNGEVASIGDKVDSKKDKVTVQNKLITANKKKYYIMLHKPRGFISTMKDEKERKCVADLVKDVPARVYPVGRLDRESEGLLLMTNDGEFANNIIHPSRHVNKVYRVTIRPGITDEQITRMCLGVKIDGKETAPAKVNVLENRNNRVVLEIIIHEGRNRQIRKMCEELGLEVSRLKRTAVGGVKLGMLPPGKWRDLTQDEISSLKL